MKSQSDSAMRQDLLGFQGGERPVGRENAGNTNALIIFVLTHIQRCVNSRKGANLMTNERYWNREEGES